MDISDSGAGSLRDAILMSNASSSANTITFAPGLSGSITLTTGQLEIAGNVTIVGPGASSLTVSGNNQSRVFQVDAGVIVSISGLTITGGRAPDGAMGVPATYVNGQFTYGGPGGAGGDGGGIYNLGTLTVSGDFISGNSAGTGGAGGAGLTIPNPTRPTFIQGGAGGMGGRGAGIYGAGSLTVANCTIANNQAGNGGAGAAGDPDHPIGNEGGLGGNGGGIYDTGAVTIMGSIIQSNKAGGGGTSGYLLTGPHGGDGGGVFTAGALSVSDSTITGNSGGFGGAVNPESGVPGGTGGDGGGIYALDTTVITGSTVSRNTTGIGGPGFSGPNSQEEYGPGGSGGGIRVSGSLTAVNCTISGNATGMVPGKIFLPESQGGGIDSTGPLRVTNCTISSNHAADTGGGIFAGGSSILNNTIVAGDTGALGDVAGALDPSGAYNIIGDGSGIAGLTAANHNQIGTQQSPVDPKLAALGNYGGPTETMALLAGSPAIDAGSNALSVGVDGKPLLTDQRGYGRIFNGTVDIGAYEFGSSIPGDANGDGTVAFKDILILARNYGRVGATWVQGDFDGDGLVGFDDFVILARNYGQTTSASPTASAFGTAGSGTAAVSQQTSETPWLDTYLPRRRRHLIAQ